MEVVDCGFGQGVGSLLVQFHTHRLVTDQREAVPALLEPGQILVGQLGIDRVPVGGGRKLEPAGKIAVLLSLDKVKLRRPIIPGDQLILEAEAVRTRARTGTLKCKAYVGSKLVAEAQIRFMMVDAEPD